MTTRSSRSDPGGQPTMILSTPLTVTYLVQRLGQEFSPTTVSNVAVSGMLKKELLLFL